MKIQQPKEILEIRKQFRAADRKADEYFDKHLRHNMEYFAMTGEEQSKYPARIEYDRLHEIAQELFYKCNYRVR